MVGAKGTLMNARSILLAAAALTVGTPAAAQPDYAAAVRADYKSSLGALFDWFHRNPELSFKETATAARMVKELRAIPGMAVTEKVGGTGVVGVMKNGAGPTILVRADMDGLPVEEASGLPNASKARQVDIDGVEKPVMHACGHDTHITGLVGTARRLAALKDRWKGTILFVVQPAEERVGGAKAMLADGLYSRFGKPDYALAWHVNSGLASGKVSASETIQYSSADSVDITVQGIGAHDEDTRQYLLKAIPRLARSIALANGLPENKLPIVKNPEGTPVTVNDTTLARRLNAVMTSTLGPDKVEPFVQKGMGGEDFAYFITRDLGVPGYYFAVGGTPQAALDAAAKGGPPVPSHHSPLFKIAPEEAVVTGTIAMTAAVLDLARPNATAQR
jgi:hippurate hydrolase